MPSSVQFLLLVVGLGNAYEFAAGFNAPAHTCSHVGGLRLKADACTGKGQQHAQHSAVEGDAWEGFRELVALLLLLGITYLCCSQRDRRVLPLGRTDAARAPHASPEDAGTAPP